MQQDVEWNLIIHIASKHEARTSATTPPQMVGVLVDLVDGGVAGGVPPSTLGRLCRGVLK